MDLFICPITKKTISKSENGSKYVSKDGSVSIPFNDDILKFLNTKDEFYEGAYKNRILFQPQSDSWLHNIPLWLINNGYLWEVREQFSDNSTLLELGCASGVDYFGSRYNMIGLDLSYSSLKGISNYKYRIQADANNLPLQDNSIDGIISSYFWEHIPPNIKDQMLKEFKRVLKPKGKIILLYDMETQNTLINKLKKIDIGLYKELFIDKDGHLGYETAAENLARFKAFDLDILKHFGMERTWFQSNSVYVKLQTVSGIIGLWGKIGRFLGRTKIGNLLNIMLVRIIDESFGKLLNKEKSRIILSVLQVKDK